MQTTIILTTFFPLHTVTVTMHTLNTTFHANSSYPVVIFRHPTMGKFKKYKKVFTLGGQILSTSALLRSSVLRMHPRVKVVAPATVAHHDRIHSPWASFTLFWKGNFIFITTMVAAGESYQVSPGGRGRRATRPRGTMLCSGCERGEEMRGRTPKA